MNLKLLHRSPPEWLNLAGTMLGEQFVDIEAVKGGTSTQIYHVVCRSGREYAVRKRDKKGQSTNFTANIKLAFTDGILPEGFNVYDCGLFYLTYYNWIYGQVYKEYRLQYADVLMQLSNLHNNKGYSRGTSSYDNIIRETKEVAIRIIEDSTFLTYQKSAIQNAVLVLNSLNENGLEKMLDNRGRLTHGDPKPQNIIMNHDDFTLIDWDKLCSVSPEFDLVYTAFAGMVWENVYMIEGWCKKNNKPINHDVLKLAAEFLPHMYLIHDAYHYLQSGKRFTYLVEEVIPLYRDWEGKVRRVYK